MTSPFVTLMLHSKKKTNTKKHNRNPPPYIFWSPNGGNTKTFYFYSIRYSERRADIYIFVMPLEYRRAAAVAGNVHPRYLSFSLYILLLKKKQKSRHQYHLVDSTVPLYRWRQGIAFRILLENKILQRFTRLGCCCNNYYRFPYIYNNHWIRKLKKWCSISIIYTSQLLMCVLLCNNNITSPCLKT